MDFQKTLSVIFMKSNKRTIDRFCQISRELFGDRGWQTKLASILGVDGSTVRRWVNGSVPIPNPVWAALECLYMKNKC